MQPNAPDNQFNQQPNSQGLNSSGNVSGQGQQPTPAAVSGGSNYAQPPEAPRTESKKKKALMLVGIIAGATVLFSGIAAGAYFGMVVPNKPENILKKAIENTSKETKTAFDGNLSFESTEENPVAAEMKISGAANSETKSFQTVLDTSVSGVNLPVELRYVEEEGYVKVGDLSTLKSLAVGYAPEAGPLVDEISSKISNQWIVFDKTLLKQAKMDCSLNAMFEPLSEQDLEILRKQYENNAFATITKTSDDEVNGQSAVRFDIEIDEAKSEAFAKGIDELSVVKKLKECGGDDVTDSLESSAADSKTPLTLWVDKANKTIVKVATQTTKAQEEKEKMKGKIELTMKYGNANIAKPENAKPAMQVVGELGPLLQGFLGDSATTQTIDTQLLSQ